MKVLLLICRWALSSTVTPLSFGPTQKSSILTDSTMKNSWEGTCVRVQTGNSSHLLCDDPWNFFEGYDWLVPTRVKDDLQSMLRTLESLFAFFDLFHVRHHKMYTFRNYLHEVNCGCEAVEALCFVLSHITWWNNFAAVKINEAVGKRSWKASKIRYVIRNE